MIEKSQSNAESLDTYVSFSEYCRIKAGELSLKLAGADESQTNTTELESVDKG